jgi:hypothetical protein
MDNDDITIPASNVADKRWTIKSYRTRALEHIVHQELAGGVFNSPRSTQSPIWVPPNFL